MIAKDWFYNSSIFLYLLGNTLKSCLILPPSSLSNNPYDCGLQCPLCIWQFIMHSCVPQVWSGRGLFNPVLFSHGFSGFATVPNLLAWWVIFRLMSAPILKPVIYSEPEFPWAGNMNLGTKTGMSEMFIIAAVTFLLGLFRIHTQYHTKPQIYISI